MPGNTRLSSLARRESRGRKMPEPCHNRAEWSLLSFGRVRCERFIMHSRRLAAALVALPPRWLYAGPCRPADPDRQEHPADDRHRRRRAALHLAGVDRRRRLRHAERRVHAVPHGADHFSEEWDDAPMPYSIFFTKKGHAIHGTNHTKTRPSGLARLRAAVGRRTPPCCGTWWSTTKWPTPPWC